MSVNMSLLDHTVELLFMQFLVNSVLKTKHID